MPSYPAEQIPVTVAQILKVAGHNAFARGERYWRAGHVVSAEYDAPAMTFSAKVSGNSVRPYSQSVVFVEDPRPHSTPFQSFCSCPVATNCKHVVAALLGWFHEGGWAAEEHEQPVRSAEGGRARTRSGAHEEKIARLRASLQRMDGGDAPEFGRRREEGVQEELPEAPAVAPMDSSWRRHLARALETQAMDYRSSAHLSPAALDLRLEVPARYGLGMGSATAAAPVRLSARPMMMGTRGTWIKGGLTWETFSRRGARDTGILPEHDEWFREFFSVVSPDQNAYASVHDWVQLEHVSSPLVWDLLERTAAIGLAVVVEGRSAEVSISPEAVLGLRLDEPAPAEGASLGERPAPDPGGLRMTPALSFPAAGPSPGARDDSPSEAEAETVDFRPGTEGIPAPSGNLDSPEASPRLWIPADRVFPLGAPQHPQAYLALGGLLHREYVQRAESAGTWRRTRDTPLPELARDAEDEPWIEDGTDLLFVPLAAQPSSLVLSLVASGTVEVPAEDVEDFAADFYPRIFRRVPITATPEIAESLPEVLVPELVLQARFEEPDDAVEEARGIFPAHTEWYWSYPDSPLHWEGRPEPGRTRVPALAGHPDPYRELRDASLEHDVLTAVRRALPDYPLGRHETTAWETRDLVQRVLPLARTLDGVRVETVGPVPEFSSIDEDPEVSVTVESTGDRDWFGLAVTVKAGNWYVPFTDVFRALDAGQKHLLLKDGTYFRLDRPEFMRLRELMVEARQLSDQSKELRISRHQAGLWEVLEELAAEVHVEQEWRDSVQSLLELEEIPAPPLPTGLRAELRPYQLEGYRWLSFLHDQGLGGVLADDMGLGKTVQTLAMVCHAMERWEARVGEFDAAHAEDPQAVGRPQRPRFLVVAPTSVAPNWVLEGRKFTPGLEITAITESSAKAGRSVSVMAAGADIVVTTYALLRLDEEGYRELEATGLVLDEAQFLKNAKTKAHRIARDLPARFKLVVTGTPMENDLMELWSMFSIVAPGLFPSARKFRDDYARPISRGEDSEALPRLRRRVKPLMLRRTKELVAADLPEKQEFRVDLPMAEEHAKIYQTRLQRERQKILGLLEDMDKHRFTIFQSLTMLRRLSLAPSLVDPEYDGVASAKLRYVQEQMPQIVADGHQALVFSQFTTFLKMVGEALEEVGIPYVYLDGSTRDRATVLERFREGEAPVFLISLKAGGFGLNLTEADYCFIMDPWWNPAAEAQAVDRTHRIGQQREVMVYRLVSAGTIEEKVMKLKDSKARLFDAVMDEGGEFSSGLAAEDIRGLLGG